MRGCLCWNCKNLGGCRIANKTIKQCGHFNKYNYWAKNQTITHIVPIKGIALAIGVSERTVYRWIENKPEIAKRIFRQHGLAVKIETIKNKNIIKGIKII